MWVGGWVEREAADARCRLSGTQGPARGAVPTGRHRGVTCQHSAVPLVVSPHCGRCGGSGGSWLGSRVARQRWAALAAGRQPGAPILLSGTSGLAAARMRPAAHHVAAAHSQLAEAVVAGHLHGRRLLHQRAAEEVATGGIARQSPAPRAAAAVETQLDAAGLLGKGVRWRWWRRQRARSGRHPLRLRGRGMPGTRRAAHLLRHRPPLRPLTLSPPALMDSNRWPPATRVGMVATGSRAPPTPVPELPQALEPLQGRGRGRAQRAMRRGGWHSQPQAGRTGRRRRGTARVLPPAAGRASPAVGLAFGGQGAREVGARSHLLVLEAGGRRLHRLRLHRGVGSQAPRNVTATQAHNLLGAARRDAAQVVCGRWRAAGVVSRRPGLCPPALCSGRPSACQPAVCRAACLPARAAQAMCLPALLPTPTAAPTLAQCDRRPGPARQEGPRHGAVDAQPAAALAPAAGGWSWELVSGHAAASRGAGQAVPLTAHPQGRQQQQQQQQQAPAKAYQHSSVRSWVMPGASSSPHAYGAQAPTSTCW